MARKLTWLIIGALVLLFPISVVAALDARNAENGNVVAHHFSFDGLSDDVRARAGQSYVAQRSDLADQFAEMDYDDYRRIAFRSEHAIALDDDAFRLLPYHVGGLYRQAVAIFHVDDNGDVTPIKFNSADFDYQAPLNSDELRGLEFPGVAGLRLNFPINSPGKYDEVVSFLGHSYFRALGKNSVYGLSARGLAINTASPQGEEFPEFTEFYIEAPNKDGLLVVNAVMDSPSLTGAFRFEIVPGSDTQMNVTARIFARKDIAQIGIAPMTSMFLFNPVNTSAYRDYRERVHDSEGLFILREDGRRLWRSLNNPARLANSWFAETNPKAFGLLQRNRDFDSYEDAEARYERRPSLLIVPEDDWGAGHIRLIEIPTRQEIHDNIVAFWTPRNPLKAGESAEYRYTMYWGDIEYADAPTLLADGTHTNADLSPTEPSVTPEAAMLDAETGTPIATSTPSRKVGLAKNLARVVDVRAGLGGVAGSEDSTSRKFIVDFEGQALDTYRDSPQKLAPRITLSRGEVLFATISPIPDAPTWRLAMDVRIPATAAVEFNAAIDSIEGERLSENWLFQWRQGDE